MQHLMIAGLGYSGSAVARAAYNSGIKVTATRRMQTAIPAKPREDAPKSIDIIDFDHADEAFSHATHVLVTAPPAEDGDPVWRRYGEALRASATLRWVGYLSTTGVYGDRGGDWVDEHSAVNTHSLRAQRRVLAEQAWAGLSDQVAVDLFRVAGIYGPGRSAFDDLRSGRARRVIKPGHAFGRIHRDDIAGAVLAAMEQAEKPGLRVLHLADDLPAESADVTAEAARLLGLPLPPALPFAEAVLSMGEMARGFWADNRKVSSALTQQWLGYRWRYPTYHSGLAGILAEERAQNTGEQSQISRA